MAKTPNYFIKDSNFKLRLFERLCFRDEPFSNITNVLSTLIQAWIDLRLLFLVCCVSPYIQGLCFPSKCKKPSFFLEIHSPILQEGNGPTRLMVICLAIAYWLSIMQNSKIFGSRMLHLQFWQSYQHNFSFSESKVTRFENDFTVSRFVVKM